MTGSAARTAPGAGDDGVTMRKETGFCTVTVSPTPPSLMARPMAASFDAGGAELMVTVWPLVTTTGRRTSSGRKALAGAQHAAGLHALDGVEFGDGAGQQGGAGTSA